MSKSSGDLKGAAVASTETESSFHLFAWLLGDSVYVWCLILVGLRVGGLDSEFRIKGRGARVGVHDSEVRVYGSAFARG